MQTIRALAASAALLLTAAGLAQPVIDRDDYARRLRGMWLGQAIANWTGLQTEGAHAEPPFLTDAAWAPPLGSGTLTFVIQNPWGADDDTDIEYVYLNAMSSLGPRLSPAQIRDAWIAHINQFIWVSNAQARSLMGNYALTPPATGMAHANPSWAMIDAQLTTEFFGAIAPGMPHVALDLADLPIRTTAAGHAAHAAQFFALLYSYAPVAPTGLTPADRMLWLCDQARRAIPDTSKAADIIDTVRADYLANPDRSDWERTRDLIYQRYQANAAANGFRYRGWPESSVNLATGVMVLLYSQGDLQRAIQIGTLSGWDSDNPTATMGGLIGLLIGDDGVRAQFPSHTLSDRYWAWRTRPTMPDYLPADPAAEDTFTLMAQRMLPLVDQAVTSAGGQVTASAWILPAAPSPVPNPLTRLGASSINNHVRTQGGTPIASTNASIVGVWPPLLQRAANAFEFDASGREPVQDADAAVGLIPPGSGETWIALELPATQLIDGLRFVKGSSGAPVGTPQGFTTLRPEIRVAGQWGPPPAGWTIAQPLDPLNPYQIIEFAWTPTAADAVRVIGSASTLIYAHELDPRRPVAPPPAACAANCDGSVIAPALNVLDFTCFLDRYRLGDPWANCDASTTSPALNVLDFACFLDRFRQGCP